MRVAYFGNNLNQGYDFVSLLAQRGISATLFDDQRTYEQDTHHWWTKRKRDESLVEYCDITQNVLCAQKKLSDMPAVQKIYEKAKNYDFLVLREYGPALFSELEGPVKVFWSMGFDLQNLPFLLDIGHPGSNKPVRKWTGIRSFLRMTCRRMGSLFSPSDPFEGKTWAEILQKRQRLGLSQCVKWILASYQLSLAQKLRASPDRLVFMSLGLNAQLREEFDLSMQRILVNRYRDYDLLFFHPSRQLFLNLDKDRFLKDNHKLFYAYKEFLRTATVRSHLIAVEKGRAEDLAAAKQLVEELGLQNHVEWIPELPNHTLRAYYTLEQTVTCDQFSPVLSTMSNTGRETTLYGRPLITSFDSWNRLDYENDWPPHVFPATTGEEITAAMRKLAAMTAEQRHFLSRQAQDWFKRNLDQERLADRFVELLHSLVKGKSNRARRLAS